MKWFLLLVFISITGCGKIELDPMSLDMDQTTKEQLNASSKASPSTDLLYYSRKTTSLYLFAQATFGEILSEDFADQYLRPTRAPVPSADENVVSSPQRRLPDCVQKPHPYYWVWNQCPVAGYRVSGIQEFTVNSEKLVTDIKVELNFVPADGLRQKPYTVELVFSNLETIRYQNVSLGRYILGNLLYTEYIGSQKSEQSRVQVIDIRTFALEYNRSHFTAFSFQGVSVSEYSHSSVSGSPSTQSSLVRPIPVNGQIVGQPQTRQIEIVFYPSPQILIDEMDGYPTGNNYEYSFFYRGRNRTHDGKIRLSGRSVSETLSQNIAPLNCSGICFML